MSEEEKQGQETAPSSVDSERRVYEIGFHLIPSLSEEKVAEEVSNIKQAVEGVEGQYITEGYPKMTALEYTMEIAGSIPKQKYDHAQFGWIKFDATPDAVEALQSTLSQNTNIIRTVVVRTVRENTLYGYKLKQQQRQRAAEQQKETENASSDKISEDEIDKSIDELVVS